MREGFGSDDAKVREMGFLAAKHLEWRLHLKRLVGSPVREVRSRHEQLPSHGRCKTTVCERALTHDAQSPPHAFGHTDRGDILDNISLQAVLSKRLSGVLTTLVGAPTNDFAAEGDGRRVDE